MSKHTLQKGFGPSAIQALSQFKEEPAWMTELRLAAWDQYVRSPLSVDQLGFALEEIQPFSEPPTAPIPSSEWPGDLQHALEERGDEEGLIVQRDSTILSRSITKESSKKGVIFSDLDSALKTVPDLVQRYFAHLVILNQPLAALNTAFWSGGTFLYVPQYLDVELPFHTCYWMSAPRLGVFPRTLIVVDQGSRVSFIDEYVSTSWTHPGLSAAGLEIIVGDGARVNYFNVQNWGQSIAHHLVEETEVHPNGRLAAYQMDMGGRTPKNRIDLKVTEAGKTSQGMSAGFEEKEKLETIFQEFPVVSIAEKLSHYVVGWSTGHRPPMTLERVAQLHPEVRL